MSRLPLVGALALALSVPGGVAAGSPTIQYFIEGKGTAKAPGNIAASANRDTIEVWGDGRFGGGRITGRGGWEHRDPAGDLLARGTWRAKRLLSYETYGPAPPELIAEFGIPRGSEGGFALIQVSMRPAGGPAFDAVFGIDCKLGAEIQDGSKEGTTVDPTTGPGKERRFTNIKKESLTLFVRSG